MKEVRFILFFQVSSASSFSFAVTHITTFGLWSIGEIHSLAQEMPPASCQANIVLHCLTNLPGLGEQDCRCLISSPTPPHLLDILIHFLGGRVMNYRRDPLAVDPETKCG